MYRGCFCQSKTVDLQQCSGIIQFKKPFEKCFWKSVKLIKLMTDSIYKYVNVYLNYNCHCF